MAVLPYSSANGDVADAAGLDASTTANRGTIGRDNTPTVAGTRSVALATTDKGSLSTALIGLVQTPKGDPAILRNVTNVIPASLPPPLISDYKLSGVDQVVRTQMEVGTPRARLRSTAQMDTVSVKWMFTDDEMTIFADWFQSTIYGGASWFGISLPVGQSGLTPVAARFTAAYEATAMPSLLWTVTATLMIRYA